MLRSHPRKPRIHIKTPARLEIRRVELANLVDHVAARLAGWVVGHWVAEAFRALFFLI